MTPSVSAGRSAWDHDARPMRRCQRPEPAPPPPGPIAIVPPFGHNPPHFEMVVTVFTSFESGFRRTRFSASRRYVLP